MDQEREAAGKKYARAEALLRGNADRLIEGGEASVSFLPGSDRFRLTERTAAGPRETLVDPDTGSSEPQVVREEVGKKWSVSPDERWAVLLDAWNVWLLDRQTSEQRQITNDGTAQERYASRYPYYAMERELDGEAESPVIAWSPDSSRFVMEKLDVSAVKPTHLLKLAEGDPRPQVVSFPDVYPEDDDEHVATVRFYVVDVTSGAVTAVQMGPQPVTCIQPVLFGHVWFSDDGERVEAVVQPRDQRELRLLLIDPVSGELETVATQRGDTVVDPNPLVWDERPAARVLSDGRAVWFSERDGWGHLWIVDDGEWVQLTRGEWVVRELLRVDEERGEVLFTACARESEGGPLDRRLYRVPLSGGEPELLTPEPLDHRISVSPSGRWLVDCQSSPQTPPVTVLRNAHDGSVARELTRADITKLEETSWRAPERFTVLSADGETELHGVLYLPPGFSEEGSWPLLDVIYPGPQLCIAPFRFGITAWQFEVFAQLGLVVMAIDGRGTPMRSKAFHDVSYGMLESLPALADHAAAIAQLAERHPGIDATRVGITGNSGGGYATVRAMIEHPDTFKVGVAGVGNHENLHNHAGWGERYIGLIEQDPGAWKRQSNVAVADRLRGHLLLGYSEMDANVNPTHTRALIAALVEADIDHDVIVLPHGDHYAFQRYPYYVRRVWDYLTRHLIGEEPPPYSISADSLPPREYVW